MEKIFEDITQVELGKKVRPLDLWGEKFLKTEGLDKGEEYYIRGVDYGSQTLMLQCVKGGETFTCSIEYINKIE